MFRTLLSRVDVEGELESPTMSQGEPLPRPFRHHSQCLLYRGLSGDETHSLAAILEVLSFWQTPAVHTLIVFLENFAVSSENCSFLCWF